MVSTSLRTSLNPPGPQGKANTISFRTRTVREQIWTNPYIPYSSLLRALFFGTPPRADGPDFPYEFSETVPGCRPVASRTGVLENNGKLNDDSNPHNGENS